MSAAAEVHMCISGDGQDDEDGGEEKYEYDYGGMELIMDDEKAKVCASVTLEKDRPRQSVQGMWCYCSVRCLLLACEERVCVSAFSFSGVSGVNYLNTSRRQPTLVAVVACVQRCKHRRQVLTRPYVRVPCIELKGQTCDVRPTKKLTKFAST